MRPIFLVFIALFILEGCLTGDARGTPDVWVIGDSYKVKPVVTKNPDGKKNEFYSLFVGSGYERGKSYQEKNFLWNGKKKEVTLWGARNEYLSFQIIIEAPDRDVYVAGLSASDLKGPSLIPRDKIKFFREYYVPVEAWHPWSYGGTTGLGEYPDPLIPLDTPKWGAPFSIEKGRNQAIWVDLYLPEEAKPGHYKGAIRIEFKDNPPISLNLRLNLWDFILPRECHLPFWACAYPGYTRAAFGWSRKEARNPEIKERLKAIEEDLWRLCHRHRLTAMSRGWYRPGYYYNAETKELKVNWDEFDKRLKGYITGTLFDDKTPPPILILPLSGGAQGRWPHWGSDGDPDGLFQAMCREFYLHLKELGWDPEKKPTFIYLCDEKGPEYHQKIIKDIRLIKEVTPSFKVTICVWSLKAFRVAFEGLKDTVDYWQSGGWGYDVDALTHWKRENPARIAGLYQADGDPQLGRNCLDAEGLGIRMWPWVAWKYNIDTLYMYLINGIHNHSKENYDRNVSPFLHPYTSFGPGQGIWVYSGRWLGIERYFSSIRLKQVRRGMQDCEYMWLAKKRGGEPGKVVNSIIYSALSKAKPIKKGKYIYGNWSHNPQEWFKARKKLAEMIISP